MNEAEKAENGEDSDSAEQKQSAVLLEEDPDSQEANFQPESEAPPGSQVDAVLKAEEPQAEQACIECNQPRKTTSVETAC